MAHATVARGEKPRWRAPTPASVTAAPWTPVLLTFIHSTLSHQLYATSNLHSTFAEEAGHPLCFLPCSPWKPFLTIENSSIYLMVVRFPYLLCKNKHHIHVVLCMLCSISAVHAAHRQVRNLFEPHKTQQLASSFKRILETFCLLYDWSTVCSDSCCWMLRVGVLAALDVRNEGFGQNGGLLKCSHVQDGLAAQLYHGPATDLQPSCSVKVQTVHHDETEKS